MLAARGSFDKFAPPYSRRLLYYFKIRGMTLEENIKFLHTEIIKTAILEKENYEHHNELKIQLLQTLDPTFTDPRQNLMKEASERLLSQDGELMHLKTEKRELTPLEADRYLNG